MTGTEKIKAKILDDARQSAQDIEQKAAEEVRHILAEAEKKAGEKKDAIYKKAESDGAEAYKRLVAVAGLEGRKEILRARQDMVEAAFRTALERVAAMPDKDYQKLLEKMVVKTAAKGAGELSLSKKDRSRVDSAFVNNINQALKKAGLEGKLTLSREELQTAGGFVLKCGDMEFNSTFEILFDMIRPELENEVVKILFRT